MTQTLLQALRRSCCRLRNQRRYRSQVCRNNVTSESLEVRCLLAATKPVISVADILVAEPDSGSQMTSVSVSLNVPSAVPVSFHYSLRNQTAVGGLDYRNSSGWLTIPAGTVNAQIPVAINGDTLDESDESFDLVFSLPFNATLAKTTARVTILDNDDAPVLTARDAKTVEGGAAFSVVSLNRPSGLPVTFTYVLADGTAHSGTDFPVASRTLTIPPGAVSTTIPVVTVSDLLDEPNESFELRLMNVSHASVVDESATITIEDNDPPSVIAASVRVPESDTRQSLDIPLSLTAPLSTPVILRYATRNRTAIAGLDYVTASGFLTIPAGVTQASITLTVLGDTFDELQEVFEVVLSGPSVVSLPVSVVSVTLDDDDPTPVVTVNTVPVTEARTAVLSVSLDRASSLPVSFRYQTVPGTASGVADFVSLSGIITLPAGTTRTTIAIPTRPDLLDEDDEVFSVALTAVVNALMDTSNVSVTILDDDVLPSVSIVNSVFREGTGVSADAAVVVSLSAPSGRAVAVTYQTAGITAAAGVDYADVQGTLMIPAGSRSATIRIPVSADAIREPAESLKLQLTSAESAVLQKTTAIVTITDDDAPALPVFQMSDLKWLGAFTVPQGLVGSASFSHGGNGLAFNPSGNSLFIGSNLNDGLNIAEIQIPSKLSPTGILTGMPVATVIQPFVSLNSLVTTNAAGIQTPPSISYETLGLGGLLVADGGLTGSLFMGYTGAEPESSSHSHFRTTSLNLAQLDGSAFQGLLDIRADADSPSGRVRAGYMAEVPEAWRAWVGADYVTGAAGQNRVQFSSNGPALFGFDAESPAGSSGDPLIYYPHDQPLQWAEAPTRTSQLLFNGTTRIDGVAFVPGTRSVVFFGSNGLSSIGYGLGSKFNDRARTDSGYHSVNGVYQYQIWAYDLNDLAAVRNGTLSASGIRPTSVSNFSLPVPETAKYIGGTAFDPTTGRLYVAQKLAGVGGNPVIHVFQLGKTPVPAVQTASGVLAQGPGVTEEFGTASMPAGTSDTNLDRDSDDTAVTTFRLKPSRKGARSPRSR